MTIKIRVHFEPKVMTVPVGIDHLRGRDLDDAINEWLEERFPSFDTGWEPDKKTKAARRKPADRKAKSDRSNT